MIFILALLPCAVLGTQKFIETPVYTEVNPGGSVRLPCQVESMKGECRWEKDGVPVGLYPGKYEMRGQAGDQLQQGAVNSGDCGLDILGASIEYDNGVWQCQVTASDFKQRDTLISEGAQLVVRAPPSNVMIKTNSQPVTDKITGRAGNQLHMECESSGGNPAPTLTWYLAGQPLTAQQAQENIRTGEGTWKAISRVSLPVSRQDHKAELRCEASHEALIENLVTYSQLDILYPPRAEASPSKEGVLSEGDSVSLSCVTDSNPPATITWRKQGGNMLTSQPSFTIQSVSKDSAGQYECVAENILGLSEPSTVMIKVKYSPVILSVTPTSELSSTTGEQIRLSCSAEGSPSPSYTWLQQLPSGEVLVRGYERDLVIERLDYEHQGEFVCGAKNAVGEVQSKPVKVQVRGAPSVSKLTVATEVVVKAGDDANLEVEFCSNPEPRQRWRIGQVGGVGQEETVVLSPNQRHGRFIVDNSIPIPGKHCYIGILRILGANPDDSRDYILELENDLGVDRHAVKLVVIQSPVSQELFVAVVVGGTMTFLIISLCVICLIKAGRCCGSNADAETNNKKGSLHHDIAAGSDKTDVESCHSSQSSQVGPGHTILPPDALYGTVEKKKNTSAEHIFNDSKEKLRPDLLPTFSRSGSPNNGNGHFDTLPIRPTTYNDLQFPKLSNCGSMKKKKARSQGINCQISTNQYGYINYLNPENNLSTFVSNKTYE